ncbi:MAG: PHP domain-containing protein, partial [Verrucomicrobiales bacterium]
MFTELHARSAFSFHRGATQPEELVQRAAELGLPALAITDRDGVYGSARAHAAAAEARGMGAATRAITGAEVTLEDGTALPLLVATRPGYQNLCRMITRAKLRAPKNESRVTYAELEEFVSEAGQGALIALSGDEEGPVQHHLGNRDLEQAHQTLARLRDILGSENLYIELQRHYARGEDWTNRRLLELAESERLPIVASNGTAFARQHERPLYDAFTCLRHHSLLDTAGSLLSRNTQRFLKSPQQMAALFADLPEAIDNTGRLAERLEFDLQDLGYQFPRFPVPSEAEHLREKTYAGARERYGNTLSKKVRNQLDHELRIITKLGFCGYFLIVWDIVNFARAQGILVQGRGSAANSAVCYSLGITACDPIGYELLFERFLSEGRESWPDIDLDLPSGDRRESVIQEVYRRFAPRGAAMTANVITYRGKSAIREMGKVLGFPESILGRFSDLYGGHGGGGDSREELTGRLTQSGLAPDHPRLPALLHLYNAVRRLPRHLGQHSGGMIICDRGLDSVVPLENASMPGRTVVQWDKDDCEDLGIIKVDLLGLGMMAAIQDTLTLCNTRPGR